MPVISALGRQEGREVGGMSSRTAWSTEQDLGQAGHRESLSQKKKKLVVVMYPVETSTL